MHLRVTHTLYVLLLVPLVLQAAPARAGETLPVMEPVKVSGYQGDEGQGLRLTFKRLRPNPGLALWTVEEGREVVESLEGEFKEAKSRPGVTVAGAKLARGLPEVPKGGLWASLSPPRFAFSGGGVKGGFRAGAKAQVSVADGTVVLMGVTGSTAAAAVSSAVSSARTTGACAESGQDGHQRHHLCTNKNDISDNNGGPWTPRFEKVFARAGIGLDDPANIIYLRDHKGPHPEAYHREIFKRLNDELGACRTRAECRAKLMDELDKIAGEVCTSGSTLNKLMRRGP